MRILVVTNLYPPHHYGGYEITCRDAVDRWRERGHDVLVLTSRTKLEDVDDDPPEMESHIRRELDVYMEGLRAVKPPLRRRIEIERHNLQRLRQALQDQAPDVVSVWHPAALSFSLLTAVRNGGTPMALVVGDEWLIYGPASDQWLRPFKDRPRLGSIATRLTKLPASLPDLSDDVSACFVSEWLRAKTRAESPFTVEPSTIIHPGVNLDVFEPRDPTGGPWRGRLLYAGRLDSRKGIHLIIRALAQLPHAELDVIGRGNEEYGRSLRELAESLGVGDRVRFGRMTRPELADMYRDADVVLYPVTWDEPFGLVPLEAMACGTPVISTGSGGASEFLVDGVNSLIVPKHDAAAIASAVARLATDEGLRASIIGEGLRVAKVMTMDHYADRLLGWHEAAAARFVHGIPEAS